MRDILLYTRLSCTFAHLGLDLNNLVVLPLHLEVVLPGLLEQLDQHGWIFSGDGGLKVDHQPDV